MENDAYNFFIKNNANIDDNKYAILYQDQKYTYADMKKNINDFELLFYKYGIKSGGRVGIILPDTPQLIFILFALWKIYAIPLLINYRFDQKKIMEILDGNEIQMLLIDERVQKTLNEVIDKFPFETYLVDNLNISYVNGVNLSKYTKEISEPYFVIYTSGTEGKPKGVVHLQKNLVKCFETFGRDVMNLCSDDIVYSVSKMTHTYGLGNSTYQVFAVGATVVLCSGETIWDIEENINIHKPTVFCAIPSIYKMLLEDRNVYFRENVDFYCAGERLPFSIMTAWEKNFGCKIINGIGTTETLTTFISNKKADNKEGSLGKCVKGFEVKIIKETGEECKVDEIGFIGVKSDIISPHYEHKELTRVNGYFVTNDLAYKDINDYFWLIGRANQLFKINGKWVNGVEIEEVLNSLDFIKDAIVINSNKFNDLDEVVGYIQLEKEYELDIEMVRLIKKTVKKRLDHFKCPKVIVIVSSLPRNANNKKIIKDVPQGLIKSVHRI